MIGEMQEGLTRIIMQMSCHGIKAYLSRNLVYDWGTLTANKVNLACSFTLILGLEALTFRQVNKGACSVILFNGLQVNVLTQAYR